MQLEEPPPQEDDYPAQLTFNPPTQSDEFDYPDVPIKNANMRYDESERKESVVTARRASSLERPDTGDR